jgi:hypothetical protein
MAGMSRDHARARAQQLGDIHGRKNPEKLSEYFAFDVWPEKAEMTRNELAAIMQQYDRARKALSPWGRFKTVLRGLRLWLTGGWGTHKPVIEAVPQPKPEEKA